MPSQADIAAHGDRLKEMPDEAFAPPSYWDEVKDPSSTVEFFPLEAGSEEYERVQSAFALTTGPLDVTINSIERVQNIGLWQAYCAKKSQIAARAIDPATATNHSGTPERNWLFHGLASEMSDKVAQLGFNCLLPPRAAIRQGRLLCPGRVLLIPPLYSPPDAGGVQTMFAVRVAVGDWSPGVRGALTPAVRDEANNVVYDSTVDNVDDPSFWCTYHGAQAYPEYRVRFTQANPAKHHPKAGQPSPNGYRPDMLAP